MDAIAAHATNHQGWNAALAAVAGGTVERFGPGTHLDVLTAWELGWRERAAQMLEADPGGASRPRGR